MKELGNKNKPRESFYTRREENLPRDIDGLLL
jgi:hypothetical protein